MSRLQLKTLSTFGTSATLLVAAAVLASMVLPGVSAAAAQKRIRPLSHDDIAQTWIGISEDELYIYRLNLSADGTGRGAYVFSDGAAKLFKIASWSYDSKRIVMVASPGDADERGIKSLEGTIVGVAMELSARGDGWSRKVHFRPEREVQARWDKVRTADSSPAQ
jgi:hypothetical protein